MADTGKQRFFVGDKVRAINGENIAGKHPVRVKGQIGIIQSIKTDLRYHASGDVFILWDDGVISHNSCAVIFYDDYLEAVEPDKVVEPKPRLSFID